MKQVTLRLKGGLGNQFFIYTFGKLLEKKYNFKIKYDLTTGFIINKFYAIIPQAMQVNFILMMFQKSHFSIFYYIKLQEK